MQAVEAKGYKNSCTYNKTTTIPGLEHIYEGIFMACCIAP